MRLPIVAFADCAPQLRFAVDLTGRAVARTGVRVVGRFPAGAGRLWQTRRFGGSSYALETSGWAAGTYSVRVQSGAAVAVLRLVVE